MICENCGSTNILVTREQISSKTKHTSLLRKIGRLFMIICTCGLWLFVPRAKENTKMKNVTIYICQNCDNTWKI